MDLWEQVMEINEKQYKMNKRIDETKDNIECSKCLLVRRINAVEQGVLEQLERAEQVRVTPSCTRPTHSTRPDDGKHDEISNTEDAEISETIEAAPVGEKISHYDPGRG